ncbi:MAG: tetratricopeptide repeat protein [Desulfobacterales bacterium]|nr:tetratricopeptide repeat protein [Desulfobacterales bacterium]
MAKREEIENDYVKKTTMMLTTLIALVVGFLIGVVFSAYKLDSLGRAPGHAPARDVSGEKSADPDHSEKALALELETSRNPGSAAAWIQLGNFYFDHDKVDGAIEAYRKALEITPDNADVLTDLGVMYRRKGQPEKAVQSFDKAIAVNPGHNVPRFNKGIVLMHDLNDHDGAIEAWEELLRLNPAAKTPTGKPLKEMIEEIQALLKERKQAGDSSDKP